MNQLVATLRLFRQASRIMTIPSAFRFAFWRILKFKELLKINAFGSHHPIFLRPGTTDIDCFIKIFINREYDFPSIKNPKVIVDAGANTGLATRFFKSKYPEAEVIAIEPEISNYELLQINCGELDKVTLLRAALWDKDELLQVKSTPGEHWSFETQSCEKAEGKDFVETITIPEILGRARERQIDFLKIDIEGAERKVFNDNSASWLAMVGALSIELHDRFHPGCASAFFRALNQFNYEFSISGENVLIANLHGTPE